MSKTKYDLVVIGGGSGGVRAARFAGSAGLKVAVVEKARWGGTCVNVGCVPKKLYAHAAHYDDALRDAAGFGWDVPKGIHDWKALKENTDRHIKRLNGIYAKLLNNSGVTLIEGIAKFTSPDTVQVGTQIVQAEHFLIATGSRAHIPDIEGMAHACTSDAFFGWHEKPERVAVVGGGYIGVELAGILHGLGSEVIVIHRGEKLLRGFDEDIRERLGHSMNATGIDLSLETTVNRIQRDAHHLEVSLSDGSIVSVDEVLFATGRRPNVEHLQLDQAGVNLTDEGAIAVDDAYRTSTKNIFAVGDVIDRMQLTPVALAEAMQVVGHITNRPRTPIRYELIPSAVFSSPNIGTVGLTELAAKAKGYRIQVFEADFRPMHHTLPLNPERAYMKTIVCADTDQVLGCHMMGPHAGEIIQGVAIALQANATKAQFDQTIGIHPTMAEEWVTMRTPRAEA